MPHLERWTPENIKCARSVHHCHGQNTVTSHLERNHRGETTQYYLGFYQYCHVCDYCIPHTNVHGGYRYWSSRRYASAASTDTSSFNKTDTQTYLYCQVAIINGIIDNITDIISLPSWQYLLMPMSLLPMRRYTYITVSVVLLTPVTISLTC